MRQLWLVWQGVIPRAQVCLPNVRLRDTKVGKTTHRFERFSESVHAAQSLLRPPAFKHSQWSYHPIRYDPFVDGVSSLFAEMKTVGKHRTPSVLQRENPLYPCFLSEANCR